MFASEQADLSSKIRSHCFEVAKLLSPFLTDPSKKSILDEVEQALLSGSESDVEYLKEKILAQVSKSDSHDRFFWFGMACLLQDDAAEAGSGSIFEFCYFLRKAIQHI